MSLISPAEAVRQFNVSKPTLYKDMEDGKLSYTLDDRNKRKIDVAELQRIYDLRPDENEITSDNVKQNTNATKVDVNQEMVPKSELLDKEIEMLKAQLANKDQELQHWIEAHDKAQSTAQKITLLLEDHTSKQDTDSEWKKSFKALENRIANQEKEAKEKADREEKILRQNRGLKKALDAEKQKVEEEKSKSVWQKLFG